MDCLYDFRRAITIHGDDVLSHVNWEISESWLRRYSFVLLHNLSSFAKLSCRFLVDQSTIGICNRWRRERGEKDLHLLDIAPKEPTPVATS